MASITDNFANMAYSTSASFDRQIMGQAQRINTLQNGGGGVADAFTAGAGKDALKAAIKAIIDNPELLKELPPPLQAKLQEAIPALRG